MNKRFVVLLVVIGTMYSCEFYTKKTLAPEQLADTIINYKSVDLFPLFPDCKLIEDLKEQQKCSQEKIVRHIYSSLSNANIITEKRINDTVYLDLIIQKDGKVVLKKFESSKKMQAQIPNLDSLISASVNSLPALEPAIKRDFPVSTQMSLPIIIKN
ncbi:hypothetical protein KH5_03970 [Urechidicola sp. KH5]